MTAAAIERPRAELEVEGVLITKPVARPSVSVRRRARVERVRVCAVTGCRRLTVQCRCERHRGQADQQKAAA